MGCGKSKGSKAVEVDAAPQAKAKADAAAASEDPVAGKGILCHQSNPDNYKVVASNAQGDLVHMTLAPGSQDDPHEHPMDHCLYILKGGKLEITNFPSNDPPIVLEPPTGAAMFVPGGAHCVKNIGESEVEILFVEPTPACPPATKVDDAVSPFQVYGQGYKILAENEDWFCGEMFLAAGQEDIPHSHKEHLLYVLEGDGLNIYPGKKKGEPHPVPVKPGFAAPIPAGFHTIENTSADTDIRIIFWECR